MSLDPNWAAEGALLTEAAARLRRLGFSRLVIDN